nr:sugar transferase [Chthonobacter albigriseus]
MSVLWQPDSQPKNRDRVGAPSTARRAPSSTARLVRGGESAPMPIARAGAWQFAIKRSLDFLLALAALIALAPLLLTIAAIIRLTSRGPVLFSQERVGLGNETFRIFKFRSMYTDRCDLSGVAQTTENDPRVTPIGRFIRRTSIDELPQLLNVLKGDMSLVGPRPHVPGMLAAGVPYDELVPNYGLRHIVRPGLTGLAQVNGYRGPTTDAYKARRRVECDLEYIRSFNVLLDIKIILRTIRSEFLSGSGC